MGQNLHVVPFNIRWAVKAEGDQNPTSVHETQEEAIEAARAAARRDGGELLVHDREGQIRDRSSFGRDPFPPEG